jgi:hypothetical protein
MRTSALATALAFSATVLAACGSSGGHANSPASPTPTGADNTPGAVIVRHFRNEIEGRLGEAWDDLYPGHRALISRERFEACFRRATNGARVTSSRVVAVMDEPIDIPAVNEKASKAVIWIISTSRGSATSSDSGKSHAVEADGRWYWIFSASAVKRVEAGRCPA